MLTFEQFCRIGNASGLSQSESHALFDALAPVLNASAARPPVVDDVL